MSIALHVDGRPGACRRTARQLTRTSQAVADAADHLFRERHRSTDGLDGGAGLAYRDRVATTANDAEMLSRCVAKLGRGLVELADALEGVAGRMERARELVAPYDLVRGDRLEEPVDQEADDPRLVQARRLAHRDAVDLVRRARKDEREAQDDWRATLSSYAIDLGEEAIPGLPAGTFLPPVEDPPHRPARPEDERPRGRPGGPVGPADGPDDPPGPGPVPPGADSAAAPAGPGAPALGAAGAGGAGLGSQVLRSPTLVSNVLTEPHVGAHLAEADPLAEPLMTDPPGTEPGAPPPPEAFHVPCHP